MFRQQAELHRPYITEPGRKNLARLFFVLVAFCLSAGAGHAVGTEDETAPPQPSETTTLCQEGAIWDDSKQKCVAPEQSSNDQSSLYLNARELAWAGRLDDALAVLNQMENSDKKLTYQGFVERRSGNWVAAESFYIAALERNPNNLLARAYYGQGLAERGDIEGAQQQLSEIRRRGGRQSWPEISLRLALETIDSAY